MYKLIIAGILSVCSLAASADVLVVTLLGTGTPRPEVSRGGAAVLIEAGHEKLLFDVGRGAVQNAHQAGVKFEDITKVFITHLHYDHIVGLPDLFLSGHVFQRQQAMEVWGPQGITEHLQHLEKAYQKDIQYRHDLAKDNARLIAHPILGSSQVVYDKSGVVVTAFQVDHGHVKPAFGYRVDYRSRSVVISGDTRYSANLAKHAKSTDLLIHEFTAISESLRKANPRLQRLYEYHTNPQDLSRIVQETKPRLTVLVHTLIFGLSRAQALQDIKAASQYKIVYGEDLNAFDIGDKIRTYKRWRAR